MDAANVAQNLHLLKKMKITFSCLTSKGLPD